MVPSQDDLKLDSVELEGDGSRRNEWKPVLGPFDPDGSGDANLHRRRHRRCLRLGIHTKASGRQQGG